jgi:L-fuconolactonase
MPDFPIIDAHVHLYDPAIVQYDWMQTVPQLNSSHLVADYDAATVGISVEGLVFAEVDAAPGQSVFEAQWISGLSSTEKRLLGLVVSAPLELGAKAEPELVKLSQLAGVRGVRRLLQGHVEEPGWCLRNDFVEAVQQLPRHGLSFDICILHPQLTDVIELCRRCPDVTFVLDHIGKPGIKSGLWEPWATQLRELAKLPHVACKISGVVTEADHQNWSGDQLKPYVKHAIDCFGFERVMFGGDWPVVELAASYTQWVAVVDEVLAGTPRSLQRKIYSDNAMKYYQLILGQGAATVSGIGEIK